MLFRSVLFSLVATGISSYLLARYLTGSPWAAWVAGLIVSFCPYHLSRALGHLNLVSIEWMPLYILCLLKLSEERSWRWIALAVFFLVLSTLCCWYQLYQLLLFTALLVVFKRWHEPQLFREKRFAWSTALVLTLALVALSPLLIPIASQGGEFSLQRRIFSADLTSFWVPGWLSTWGRQTFQPVWSSFAGDPRMSANYLGYIALFLAIVAWRRMNRKVRFWGLSALVFWVLALGPWLTVLGRETIPLPDLILREALPFYWLMRAPERLTLLVVLSLSVMSAYTVADFTRSMSRLKRACICFSIGVLICLEYLALPFPTMASDVPDFVYGMAQDREQYAIIDTTGRSEFHATFHGKPWVGGYISRYPKEAELFLERTPVVATLLRNRPLPSVQEVPGALELMRQLNIRYVLVQRGSHHDLLHDRLGLLPVHEAGEIAVYDLKVE